MKHPGGQAAQYVRMSTDKQRYSIEHQIEAIALYASRRGLAIVQSYEDAGKSGLSIDGRFALQRLIADVRSGVNDFGTILVYDVSRWGRFQDSDESAYYEFLCRDAGVRVEYCAESFENDGSLTSTVIKNIKRAMAGEFSRELSKKVFAGQAKAVRNGFHQGSTPGYGLRRCLVDEGRVQRTELAAGQRKRLSTDRVILVPGPAKELLVVNEIYDLFIDLKYSLSRIARILNDRKVVNVAGRPWNDVSIREVLSNEKYIGNSVYNRTSRKLNGPSKKNPPSDWIRSIGSFEAILPRHRFLQAQLQLKDNARAYDKNELLDYLTAVWCREKRLSAAILASLPSVPSVQTFNAHFGGLAQAYQQIGYYSRFSRGRSPHIRLLIMSEIVSELRRLGCTIDRDNGSSQMLVNGELVVAVVAGCAVPACGKNQWQIGRKSWAKPDILLVARVHEDERAVVEDYLLIPMMFLTNTLWLTISNNRLARMQPQRSKTLKPLLDLCTRQKLGALR